MILADKIVELRKKEGLSQEELAEKIGVSRQSVSKWEGAQSAPDMNKIIALSELFGVSTDYLLKDSIGSPAEAPAEDSDRDLLEEGELLHPVDMEEANAFLANNEKNAGSVAFGVALCIFSPIVMILLASFGEAGIISLTADQGSYLGLAVLLIMVAAAVAIFVTDGMRSGRFEYLKKEPIDTAYGVDGMVKERRTRFETSYIRGITIGVILCVLSCVPLFIGNVLYGESDAAGAVSVAALLFLVGVGVFFIVKNATIWTGFKVLLEEGEYTREQKKADSRLGGIYWSVVTAGYLIVSFVSGRWDLTWTVWPVAGILYGVIIQAFKMRSK